jgi:hypothetical protein
VKSSVRDTVLVLLSIVTCLTAESEVVNALDVLMCLCFNEEKIYESGNIFLII